MTTTAHVVSFASSKGGPGKTTAAFAIGTDLALAGHDVIMLDADPNRHLLGWAGISPLPRLKVVAVTEEDILDRLARYLTMARFILIDLEGTANMALAYAASQSQLVVVPAQQSSTDVKEALRTIVAVDRAASVVKHPIPHRVLMSKMPILSSRAATHARTELVRNGATLFQVEMLERTAFREMTFNGLAPCRVDPSSNAAANVRAITAELVATLAATNI